MGTGSSKDDEDEIHVYYDAEDGAPRTTPSNAAAAAEETFKTVGLENFGNTCYCNSVIQLLYACTALRHRALALHETLLARAAAAPSGGGGLLSSLSSSVRVPPAMDTVLFRFCELVQMVHKSKDKKKKSGASSLLPGQCSGSPIPVVVASPAEFVQRVKKENVVFRNAQQQDAHEFAMFVVNCLIENERALLLQTATSSSSASSPLLSSSSTAGGGAAAGAAANHNSSSPAAAAADVRTPIQDIFEGSFAAETSCMECESTTARIEPFFDLSLEIEQNASLGRCILNFSSPEFLMGAEKFRCDACCASTPARRCVRLHKAPSQAMLIHLKRFKFHEERQVFKKLSWRVCLPNELAVHTTTTTVDAPAMFRLKGFVLHQGSGPNLGHYICCVRFAGNGAGAGSGASTHEDWQWKRFDDDLVHDLTEREVQQYFGLPFTSTSTTGGNGGGSVDGVSTSTAYILLYERI